MTMSIIALSFVIPDDIVDMPPGYDGYSGDPEDQARFVPDIQEWVDEYLPGRTTLFYYDALETEQGGRSFWMVTFRSEADKILFKLHWTDDERFMSFRKWREDLKRCRTGKIQAAA
jgi:hypothetical protein